MRSAAKDHLPRSLAFNTFLEMKLAAYEWIFFLHTAMPCAMCLTYLALTGDFQPCKGPQVCSRMSLHVTECVCMASMLLCDRPSKRGSGLPAHKLTPVYRALVSRKRRAACHVHMMQDLREKIRHDHVLLLRLWASHEVQSPWARQAAVQC